MRRNLKLVLLLSVAWAGGFLYYFTSTGRAKVGRRCRCFFSMCHIQLNALHVYTYASPGRETPVSVDRYVADCGKRDL